jgi:hypothetical protein
MAILSAPGAPALLQFSPKFHETYSKPSSFVNFSLQINTIPLNLDSAY